MAVNLAPILANLITGIYVLTAADGDVHHGMSSSWVTQVSGVPLLFMASVDNRHFSRELIARTGTCGLNIVGRRGKRLEDHFYSPQAKRPDNLGGLDYELSPMLKVPWLKLAIASIEARIVDTVVAGDHSLLIAEPVGMRMNEPDRPLTSLELDYVYVGGKEVVKRDRTGW